LNFAVPLSDESQGADVVSWMSWIRRGIFKNALCRSRKIGLGALILDNERSMGVK